jgi:Ca2+-binding RTX toxin-like protein
MAFILGNQTNISSIKRPIFGTFRNDQRSGTNGDDAMFGRAGNDTLDGRSGNDDLFGEAGNDVLRGSAGKDLLDGGTGNDTLEGRDGNDIYRVDSSGDRITENGTGRDTVLSKVSWTLGTNLENLVLEPGFSAINGTGNSLNNTITGNNGNNVLSGLDGNDSLFGGSGRDSLLGGAGNDFLAGGVGNDTLTGGGGVDRFDFRSPNEGVDRITDFVVADDTIGISTSVVSGFRNAGLTPNAAIRADQFRIGSGAADGSDRFIYNSTTGSLFFDRDGIGGTAQVQIASLSSGLAMTNADIFVSSVFS